ncbi:MAG: HAD-IA family hydrolase [Candidatus Bathyarchaeia archaeon]|jgi:putative hydrolase of the HAD superfamily
MTRVSAVVFDLDNVLYDEKEYVYAAFRSIAHFLSGKCGFSEDQVYSKLVFDFEKKGSMYPRLFNDALSDLGLDQNLVPEILKLYALVDSKVELFLEATSVLLALRSLGLKLALVTNGNVRIQSNKVRLLGVEKFFDVVVYARETPSAREKPYPEAYEMALQKLGVGAGEAISVGDNPHTDFLGAKQLGMRTVRVLWGEFKDVHLSEEYEAEIVLHTLPDLLGVVKQLNS